MDLNSLGPAGAAVAIVALFLKFMKDAFGKLTASVDKNTQVSEQLHDFLVNLNGSLRKSVKDHKK